MGLYYIDESGNNKPYYMGCYGIGLGRIIACLIENNIIKDNNKIKGFSLPIDIAPYKIQIVYSEENKKISEKLYSDLISKGIKVIIDDRDKYSLGEKIKDCYVLGTPYIAILGKKFDGENIEVEETKSGKKMNVNINEISKLFKHK